MFDIGFSEILLIFVIALVVLGPEKLPRLASQVGRWVGRARAMARQFREQLEEEVNLEEVRKAQDTKKPTDSATEPQAGAATGAEGAAAAAGTADPAPDSTKIASDPAKFHANTFSYAHPTDEYGANPYTPNGAAEPPSPSPSSAQEPQSAHPSDPDAPPHEERSRTAESAGVAQTPAAPTAAGDTNSRQQRQTSGEAHTSTARSPHDPDSTTTHSPQQPASAGADPHGQV